MCTLAHLNIAGAKISTKEKKKNRNDENWEIREAELGMKLRKSYLEISIGNKNR